ncbi:MAG: ArsB/NhaD family transporter [Actinomycetota bacterium]|nr:ArsB/NhaD family transporter [Actinomycetota bacterium]
MSGTLATTLTLVIFVAAYVLIATEKIPRTAAALGGAALMAALGIVSAEDMFFSHETGVDWNVIFLLLGMMIVVSVVKQTGLFDYLAIWSAKRARGEPFRVMVMLVLITAVASAFLDNVTTVLLIAPVTLLVCDRLGIAPIPFLIAEVLASNIGGTATLIGDPPNIIIASRTGLSFNDFLVNLGPIVVVLLVVFVAMCRVLFRRDFSYDPERVAEVMALDERQAIRDRRLLVRSLVVLSGIILAFVLHSVLHFEPAVVALLGAGVIVLVSRLDPEEYLEEVEWGTLVFFVGLFIMVGALVHVGVIERLGEVAVEAVGDQYFLAATGLVWGSAVLSAIVDNIPYVATMTPLVQDLVDAAPNKEQGEALWWALALGADLGGNATAVGASANVVVLGIAARNGHPISFWQFTKYGLVVAFVTIFIAWIYVWLRYFAMG